MLFPDGHTLAVSSSRIHLLDISDSHHLAPLTTLSSSSRRTTTSVAVSRDGRTLAAGFEDATAAMWDVSDPQRPRTIGQPITGHTLPVNAVAFSPDSMVLATGSHDSTVRLWTVPARSQPQQLGVPLRVDLGPVTALAFAPDGTTLATGSGTSEVGYDGGVLLWDIRAIRDTTADLTGIACRQALRGLTTKEWSQVVPGLDYRPSC